MIPTDRFYARVEFREFIRHFRKLDDAAIVADVRQSMDDIEELNVDGSSFGALMVKWSLSRKERYPNAQANGLKGGRPRKHFGDAPQGDRGVAGASGFATSPAISQERPGKSANDLPQNATGGSGGDADGQAIVPVRRPQGRKEEKKNAFGSAKNVMMTDAEFERVRKEYGDVSQIVEELSDYIRLHPQKYRDHYAALRTWCRRRRQEGRNPDGTKMTQGDRLARYFANREQEIIHEHRQDQDQ